MVTTCTPMCSVVRVSVRQVHTWRLSFSSSACCLSATVCPTAFTSKQLQHSAGQFVRHPGTMSILACFVIFVPMHSCASEHSGLCVMTCSRNSGEVYIL